MIMICVDNIHMLYIAGSNLKSLTYNCWLCISIYIITKCHYIIKVHKSGQIQWYAYNSLKSQSFSLSCDITAFYQTWNWTPVAVAISDIPPQFTFNSDLVKSSWFMTSVSVVSSLWNIVQRITVLLACSVHSCEMIVQLDKYVSIYATEISRDSNSNRGGYPKLQHPAGQLIPLNGRSMSQDVKCLNFHYTVML